MDSEILTVHNLLRSTYQQLRNTSQFFHDINDVFIKSTQSSSSNRNSISYNYTLTVVSAGEYGIKKKKKGWKPDKATSENFRKNRKNKKGGQKTKNKNQKSQNETYVVGCDVEGVFWIHTIWHLPCCVPEERRTLKAERLKVDECDLHILHARPCDWFGECSTRLLTLGDLSLIVVFLLIRKLQVVSRCQCLPS